MKPTDNTCNIILPSFWLVTLTSTPSLFTASCGLVWFEESIGEAKSLAFPTYPNPTSLKAFDDNNSPIEEGSKIET
jgi:hypothetical protein